MGIRGDLQSIPLWEVLQTLSIGKKTGRLEIDTGVKKAEIFFENGKIVNVRSGFIEGYNAILGLALWDRGDFVFYPDEKAQNKILNLDPLEIIVNLSQNLDLMNYLGDFVLLPVRIDGLALEEEVVSSSFDGIAKVRDVVMTSPLGELKTLELLRKLIDEEKLIRVDDDERVFWVYILWRFWRFLTQEDGRKYLTNERALRKDIQTFISKMEEDISGLLEDLINSEKTSWHYFYRHLLRMGANEIEVFIRNVFDFLNKYVKSEIDKTKSEQFSTVLKSEGSDIFLPVGRDLKTDEFIISYLFNGERTLRQVFDYSPFEKIHTQNVITTLINNNCLINIKTDYKLALIHSFYIFWSNLTRELKDKSLIREIERVWSEFKEGCLLDVKYLFGHIILDKKPNFIYFYKEKDKYGEDEIKSFIISSMEVIYNTLEGRLGKDIKEEILSKIIREIEDKIGKTKEIYTNLIR
ncbi:DUF4388 domain-containing protein [Dictyoglomus thermophilum]|uniref:PatA-like N-terminal domain-containing protein n=1 Tax=Dictyoglomus thermophilum (strain ATCC 35947 / DSM 3960 / H-6-12) TaxID=309799 RepID=B5YAA2_DICT6|nr:DUF4388 domain-containing protein [Dictyoglomus thermophilum]ACI19343.1 hypothetical protein DICTH_1557 [Dictyoglomus thermophilum H-6-12]